MRALSAADLLDVWEQGRTSKTPIDRALALLGVAFAHVPEADLCRLTVGQRDSALLHLRELTFGSHMNAVANCPACQQRLELSFDIRDLPEQEPLQNLDDALSLQTQASLEVAGYEVAFRIPNSTDIACLETSKDDEAPSGRGLLERCLVHARHEEKPVPVEALPGEVVDAVLERMGETDPLADLKLNAKCPECGHAWQIGFDIVSYFWSEIEAWAMRIMSEVHMLASAYGWREADILAMSAWRRQCYLEMIGA